MSTPRRSKTCPRFVSWPLLTRLVCALLLGAAMAVHAPAAAQSVAETENVWMDSKAEDISVHLVTFGPGDEVYNYFGHNAIVVHDNELGMARLYNYGMFRFGPEMLPSYMKGRLTFWVGQTPVRPTFTRYFEMNRSVREQELNLSPEKRLFLARALGEAVLPANRYYLYHHYENNCSTKLRDLIDQAVGGQFKQALNKPARLSYRQHTRRYASKDPFIDFVLLFWMNDQMERRIEQWDELFLPEELELQVASFQYVNEQGKRVPLVDTAYTVFEARRPPTPERPPTTWPWTLLVGTLLGAAAWLCAQWMLRTRSSFARRLFGAQHAFIGLLFGLPGLLGFLMWTLTEHVVTYHNENQLLANPLTFLALPLGIAIAFGSKAALRLARGVFYALSAMSLLLLLLKLLPNFDQDVLLTMTLLLPLNLGYALAHRALQRQSVSA